MGGLSLSICLDSSVSVIFNVKKREMRTIMAIKCFYALIIVIGTYGKDIIKDQVILSDFSLRRTHWSQNSKSLAN